MGSGRRAIRIRRAATRRAYWNGFYDAPDDGWQTPTKGGSKADWQLVRRPDGALGWRQSAMDVSQRHQLLLSGSKQEAFVQTSMIVDEVAGAGGLTTLRSATVSYGFGLNTLGDDVYYSCGVRRDASSSASDIVLAVQIDDQNATGWSTRTVGAAAWWARRSR